MRTNEHELALLRLYVAHLEVNHGLRSDTAQSIREDIAKAQEGDIVALALCLGQIRTARNHKQGSLIIEVLERGMNDGDRDGVSRSGPGAGGGHPVAHPEAHRDQMRDVGRRVHRLGQSLRGRVLARLDEDTVRVGWTDGTVTVEKDNGLAFQREFNL